MNEEINRTEEISEILRLDRKRYDANTGGK